MLVEVSTDNRNRTASEIRSLLTKNGGTIATAGSVSRLFHRKGQIIVPREAADEDQLMEAGAGGRRGGFQGRAARLRDHHRPGPFRGGPQSSRGQGHQGGRGGSDVAADRHRAARRTPAVAAVNRLIDALEDHDDVKEVYSNAGIPGRGRG